MDTTTEDTNAAAAPETTAHARSLLQAGELQAAEQCLQALVQQVPAQADALHLMGIVRAQQGRLGDAVALFDQALELQPDDAALHHNRGNALALLRRWSESLASLDRSLALRAFNADALVTRSRVQFELQGPLNALATLDRAIELQPQSDELRAFRAELLASVTELDEYRREAAVRAYGRSLEEEDGQGDEDKLQFHLAAMGVVTAPPAAPRHLVTGLFDDYAERFEQHLLQALDYRTPALIGNALEYVGMSGDAEVLDLGCGTGLCADVLRPLARRLVGVDLSPNMLAKARERALYDELVCADLVEHLQPLQGCVDLAVAADVFVYVGDLQPVFESVRRSLRAGGRFVFSIESHPGEGYALQPTRRYAHAAAYVEQLAAQHGLQVTLMSPGPLRKNAGEDVAGFVVVLQAD